MSSQLISETCGNMCIAAW